MNPCPWLQAHNAANNFLSNIQKKNRNLIERNPSVAKHNKMSAQYGRRLFTKVVECVICMIIISLTRRLGYRFM